MWSHIFQTICARRFFYGITLGRSDAYERIVAAGAARLRVVLTGEEIVWLPMTYSFDQGTITTWSL